MACNRHRSPLDDASDARIGRLPDGEFTFEANDVDVGDFEAEEYPRCIDQNRRHARRVGNNDTGVEAALNRLEELARLIVASGDDDLIVGLIESIENEVQLIGIDFVVGMSKALPLAIA